jgi:hypothetical protein
MFGLVVNLSGSSVGGLCEKNAVRYTQYDDDDNYYYYYYYSTLMD